MAQLLLVYHLPLLFFIFKSVVAKVSRESSPTGTTSGTDKDCRAAASGLGSVCSPIKFLTRKIAVTCFCTVLTFAQLVQSGARQALLSHLQYLLSLASLPRLLTPTGPSPSLLHTLLSGFALWSKCWAAVHVSAAGYSLVSLQALFHSFTPDER